jgi:GntR family transcriptional regulator
MAFETTPPKYARVVATLQERITDGEYAAGSPLPSEEQLVKEFGVSRTTVIRALQILGQQGWIDAQQGKGRFVRGIPAFAAGRTRPGRAAMEADESTSRIIDVGHVIAPDAIAAALKLHRGEAVLRRRRVVLRDDEPSELVTGYFPLPVAYGTNLDSDEPLTDSSRQQIEARHKLRFDHVTERIAARAPAPDETDLLGIPGKRTPVLVLTVIAYEATGRPLQATVLVLPGDSHELEDTYPLT